MSAIAGICSLRGAPVRRDVLQGLSQALLPMGPDGERFFTTASLGMVFRPFHTDAQSRRTTQPLRGHDGLVVAFDGRIDNERELRAAMGVAGREAESGPGLVLEAYRRWELDAFARVIGDFALALWDADRQRLVLATDAMGRRPLYYLRTADQVMWASLCRPLLRAGGLEPRVDEGYVADYLANRASHDSPFQGIGLLPGGHLLLAGPDGVQLRRYWAPDPAAEIRYRTDAEYQEHFTALFREAVACRMRAEGAVVCELSGGVDSSTITCMADRLVREGAAAAPGMHTVSFVFDHAASSDERRYIAQVEARLGRTGIHISEDDAPLLQPLPEGLAPDTPGNRVLFLARQDQLIRRMREMGARVVLSGIGGDQMFWSQPVPGQPLADLLVQGRLVRMLRECSAWSRAAGGLPWLKTLWMGGVRPLLPRRALAALEPDARAGEWLHPEFVKRTGFRERMLPPADDAGFRLPSRATQWGFLRRTMRPFALERWSGEGYLDARYPYLDRRLVEFALAIPLEQALRPGESRSLVRRSLRGLVPPAVLERRTKTGPAEALNRALIREWPWLSALFREARVAELGFVKGDAFRAALHRARHGMASNQSQLLKTISLELWLRTLDDRPRSGDTPPPDGRHTIHHGGTYEGAVHHP